LERVEEQAGAFRVEAAGGDALQDDADGGLDRRTIFGDGELETGVEHFGFHFGTATAVFGRGAAGGVVVVAEGLAAEAAGAAAVAVGEDVTALVAGFGRGRHGVGAPPQGNW
jgi:hypothetical protein